MSLSCEDFVKNIELLLKSNQNKEAMNFFNEHKKNYNNQISQLNILSVFCKYCDKVNFHNALNYYFENTISKTLSFTRVLYYFTDEMIETNNLEMLKYFVEDKKVDLKKAGESKSLVEFDEPSHYLIMFAASNGTPEMIDYLSGQGLDIYSNSGKALVLAAANNKVSNLKHLIEHYKMSIELQFNWKFAKEKNLISFAAEASCVDTTKYLLEMNAPLTKETYEIALRQSTKKEILDLICETISEEELVKIKEMNNQLFVNSHKENNDQIIQYYLLKKELTPKELEAKKLKI